MSKKRTFFVINVCKCCSKLFISKANHSDVHKFCDQDCYKIYKLQYPEKYKGYTIKDKSNMRHNFTKGHAPWNKGVKGLHLNPTTEFKSGPRPETRAPIMSTTIRLESHGTPRILLKIGQPDYWMYYSHYVWAKHNGGPVPDGHVLYHKDGDSLNEDYPNLELLTRAEVLSRNSDGRISNYSYYNNILI